MENLYQYRARIIDVYDGDTATAIADLGFHVSKIIKMRFYGIDTPEIRGKEREAGLISRDRVIELILDKEVIIKTYKDKKDKYGRWLAEIYLPGETKSINTLLLEEGLAKPYLG
jgi:micrococcal nuclease